MTAPGQARTDAVAAAGAVLADGIAARDSLPPRQAAELAWTPSGPSVDELEQRIIAQRAGTPTPVQVESPGLAA